MDRFVTPAMPSSKQRARSERRNQDSKMAAAAIAPVSQAEPHANLAGDTCRQPTAELMSRPAAVVQQTDTQEIPAVNPLQHESEDRPVTYASMVRAIQDAVAPLLEKHTTQIQQLVEEFKGQLHQIASKVNHTEARLGETFQDVHELKGKYDSLQKEHLQLCNKIDDLENRSRRCNLRVLGLPETVKGPELFKFLQVTLPDLLQIRDTCLGMVVERAHRLGPARTTSGDRPRVVIFKSLSYIHKEAIWQASRKCKDLRWEGSRLLIFQDYSAEVTRARKEFAPLCSNLIKENRKFALLYPARLRLYDGNVFKEFTSVADAHSFLKELREEHRDVVTEGSPGRPG